MSSAGTDPGCSVDDEDLVDDDHGDADGGDHHHGHHPDLVLRRETPTALHLAAVQIRATRKCESVSQVQTCPLRRPRTVPSSLMP